LAIWAILQFSSPERLETEFAMLSSIDWVDENEMTMKSQTESYSNEDMTTSAEKGPSVSSLLMSLKTAITVIGVLGTLTNGVVLGGFCFAGRSKMNSSSVHIANHTILQHRPTTVNS